MIASPSELDCCTDPGNVASLEVDGVLMGRLTRLFAALLLCLGTAMQARADQPSLALSESGVPRRLTASELLARADVVTLMVPNDISYGRQMTYLAVPLL